jgi:phosphotransferase system HPr (HPr) family protein
LRIASPLGLHARASSRVVAYFSKLESAKNKDVHFVRNGQKADPRSIMSLMLLAVPTGQVVEIRFKGYSRAKIEDVMIDIGMTPETELPDRWMWNESKPQL